MAEKFKAVLTKPDVLKDSVNAISALINEGVFSLGKDGISMKSMDSANVAMVDMLLLSSAFKSYELAEETEIGLNISDLTNVLKRAKAEDEMTLELEDGKLTVSLSGKVRRAFNIPLLDIRGESKTPSLEFPVSIELKSGIIEDGIADAEIVSDAVVLEADPDNFIMKAEGDSRKSELKVDKDNESIVNLTAKDHVKSIFPLDYLKKMFKASKLTDTAVLQLGQDYPLRLDFKIQDQLQLGFILAPRIENE